MQDFEAMSGPWGPRPLDAAERPAAEGPVPVVFRAARRDFAALTRRGLALYIPSFGFNRFWLRTEQRRHFWLNTTLGGDSFEYRGTARELVVGFLFALAIYLPAAAAYSLAGIYAETVQAYASLPFFIFTFAFGHYAAFRARRYRLTRTGFRGLRFWMRGSGWIMAFGAFAWSIGLGITLGLAYPWMVAWLERYKMRHSSYGDLPGAFHGTGWGLFRALAGPVIGFVALALAIVYAAWFGFLQAFLDGSVGILLIILPLVALWVLCGWSVLSVVRARWLINGIAFGAVRPSVAIRATAMLWPALKLALLLAVVGVVWFFLGYILVTGLAQMRGLQLLRWVASDYIAAGAGILWTLCFMIIAMYLKAILYTFEFHRRLAAATSVSGLVSLDAVTADGTAAGALGEGLADALGADGF